MMYRCRACEYESERGWLRGDLRKPPSSSSSCCAAVVATFLVLNMACRTLLQFLLTGPDSLESLPWWVELLSWGCAAAGVLVMAWLLERAEFFFIRRKPCPQCGVKRWSRGYIHRHGFPGIGPSADRSDEPPTNTTGA
jgi:hypothetical protein